MNESNSIKNWHEDERPRERLMQKGAASLSDTELLAILISSGTKEKSAIELARDTLALAQNNINELGKLSLQDLQKTKGIGVARAITICAALELGRRRQIADAVERLVIRNTKDAVKLVVPLLKDLTYESCCVVYLNTANRLIHYEIISSGGLSATVIDIRVILKNALLCGSNRIVVAHNHPSGDTKPSQQDNHLTKQMVQACEFMNIILMDHIIVAGNSYLSYADEGLM